jgi:ribonucleotide monophosphatase NagD (HAD superfamily)
MTDIWDDSYTKAPKTIISDIDGTLIEQSNIKTIIDDNHEMKLLPGVREKLDEWEKNGYNIILITGRKENLRQITEQQLRKVGICYDHLVMGVGPGPRYLLNDAKPNGQITAFSYCVKRNQGLENIEI